MSTPLAVKNKKPIIAWLVVCAALVALMVFVGGYTRLSGSGLSITQWKPIHGMVPPLNETAWNEEFASYQASPQYALVNKGMSLDEFKTIFWPEFFHRLLARAVGFVFLLPLLYFAFTKSITRSFGLRLAGIFALGGLQGVIGWVMVASGLVDAPYVNHFKLAAHLSIALAIFAFILWAICDLLYGNKQSDCMPARQSFGPWFALLAIQIIFGALVAGLHAGLIFNTWPLMNGEFLPSDALSPPFSENLALIQFIHRHLAILVSLGFGFWWYSHREYVKNRGIRPLCTAVLMIIGAQFTLGVLTLLNSAPLHLALTHQMTALLLWAAATCLLHRIARN